MAREEKRELFSHFQVIKIVIKPVLPSLREKKRYIVFEIKAEKPLRFEEVEKELKQKMLQFLGELGYAKAGVIMMDYWENNQGIVRTDTKNVDNVKTALALVKNIGDSEVIIKTIGVSGILKKAKSKFIKGG